MQTWAIPNLNITGPPIKVQMEVFYLSILCKLVCDILFCSFFVNVCYHYDPPLDGWGKHLSESLTVWLRRENEHRAALVSVEDSTRSNF
jgi:hypothetical protein